MAEAPAPLLFAALVHSQQDGQRDEDLINPVVQDAAGKVTLRHGEKAERREAAAPAGLDAGHTEACRATLRHAGREAAAHAGYDAGHTEA
eukprot:1156043-Pelagomonas_calceolata.AAC.24